jgi:hypothetical protein
MRFEARELKPYAEPVSVSELQEGEIYFSVQFADDDLLIPIVETWVFAGRNQDLEDTEERLYFQDVESYRHGIRYATATADNATFQIQSVKYINHIFDYEHALD